MRSPHLVAHAGSVTDSYNYNHRVKHVLIEDSGLVRTPISVSKSQIELNAAVLVQVLGC